MERQISATDEMHMTDAIRKAASLATSDTGKDRNRILADCLMEKNVDSRFAKVASAAFNKHLTVLTFQSEGDDKRTESFPLADGDSVYAMMGGVQEKTASSTPVCKDIFHIGMAAAPAMAKAASANVSEKPVYEDRVSAEILSRHIESMLQKQAAEHERIMADLMKAGNALDREHDAISAELEKQAAFQLQNIRSYFGDVVCGEFPEAFGDACAVKTASRVVDPDTVLSRRIASYLEKKAEYKKDYDAVEYYQEGLEEFAKTASSVGLELSKQAALKDVGSTFGPMLPFSLGALTSEMGSVAGFMQEVRNGALDIGDTGLDNAYKMYMAGQTGTSPNEILSADFLTRERFRDRLMGWSDMAADPMFASTYKSAEIFRATQRAMDMDPALERPDHRELLRANVGALLAQGGRFGREDISANAVTEKAIAGGKGSGVYEAAAPVALEESKKAPELALGSPTAAALRHLTARSVDDAKSLYDNTEKLFAAALKDNRDKAAAESKARADATKAKANDTAATLKATEQYAKALGYKLQAFPNANGNGIRLLYVKSGSPSIALSDMVNNVRSALVTV